MWTGLYGPANRCLVINRSRFRPDRNNLGISTNPAPLSRSIFLANRASIVHPSHRDNRPFSSLGRNSGLHWKGNEDPSSRVHRSGRWIHSLPIPTRPCTVRVLSCTDGTILLKFHSHLCRTV